MIRENQKGNLSFLFTGLVSFVAILVLFSACRNPFSGDMGDKITVGRPTISDVLPSSAALLTGRETFQGQAWAHRELRRVEVRIGSNTTGERFADEGNPILDWTNISEFGGSIAKTEVPGEGIFGQWEFVLDTLSLPEGALIQTMGDGRVMMRFRVWDSLGYVESDELAYSVKNLPSQITTALPSYEAILEFDADNPIRVAGGAAIQGRVTDLRGLAPGYPMIQIWPADRADITADPDAFANHSSYGLASMFLTTLAPTGSVTDNMEESFYDSRLENIVNVANFQFRLNSFSVELRDDGVRKAVFDPPSPMTGAYRFRIITKDTREIVGHFPPYAHGTDHEDRTRPGVPIAIEIINDAAPPAIEIDNSDLTTAELEARPNIYITTGINERKIAIDDPNAPGRNVFRLRAVATHDDGISNARLTWEHRATNRGGELPLVELPRTADQTKVYFTFTANHNTRDEDGNLIFTTHPAPYTLTLRVLSRVGSWGERSFNIIMDGEIPRVEIRPSIRGAVAPPAGNAVSMHGGFVNNNHIVVNGNIQVSVDRTSSPPIMFDGEKQMVKWFVEPIPVGPGFDVGDFLNNPTPNSILYRLIAFRNNPTQANLAFFHDDFDGLVNTPITTGQVPHEAYGTHNFKLDTGPYGGQDLWLYVVAMNQVHNIGFSMQRIRVDQSSDIPVIDVPGLFPIETQSGLETTVTGDDPASPDFGGNWPRRNTLSGDQGINVRVSDDDGIVNDSNHIVITLYDPGTGVSAILDNTKLQNIFQGTPRAWSGTLSQSAMSDALRAAGAGNMEEGATRLPDGMYRLGIKVWDGEEFKVRIGDTPPVRLPSGSGSELFWFAVHNHAPTVAVTAFENNVLMSKHGINIEGTVQSSFRLQSLWITFDPDVIAADPGNPGYEDWVRRAGSYEMFGDESRTVVDGNDVERFFVDIPAERGPDGLYTYRWQVRNVFFTTGPGDPGPERERREFTLRAFDSMGFVNAVAPNWVRVDVEPPTVRFTSFNQGRPLGPDGDEFVVWGNVHFAVSVTDTHGLGSEPLPPGLPAHVADEELSNVKWWLLRHDADSPSWDTPFPSGRNGAGGRFFSRGNLSAAFEAVFDSRALENGERYKLYVIAQDAAGNEKTARLNERDINRILVNQSADRPELGRLAPEAGILRPDTAGNLRITGLARDTDGFAPAMTGSYVEILFYDDGWNPNGWLPVLGTLDGTGAIDFAFDVVAGGVRNADIPGTGDGLIVYRIRISDEPAAVEGRTRNKNPQLDSHGNSVHTFILGDNSLPNIDLAGAAVSHFPYETGSFSFALDTTPPEIVFMGAAPPRMFRHIDDLFAAFPSGKVIEDNLRFLEMNFGNNPPVRLLDDSTPPPPSSNNGEYEWSLESARSVLTSWFNGAGEGRQTITFVAEDMAGNRSPSMDWDFVKDTIAPTVGFTSFNQGRPGRVLPGNPPVHEFEIWGNVHFAVSVTDMHGIGNAPLPPTVVLPPGVENNMLADVKWWLLRHGAQTPSWNTPFPTGPDGTGGRFFAHDGAVFEAVFDSRALAEGELYRLYVIAVDVAGNERLERGIDRIRVNQAADLPELVRSAPANGVVLRPDAAGNLLITGLARDTDGFDPGRVGSGYVEIQFSADGIDWGSWLPVPGTLDGTGAIDFAFYVKTFDQNEGRSAFAQSLPSSVRDRGDGPIHYRLRISDEPEAVEGRARNKNPQLETGHTFLTTGNALPVVPMANVAVSHFPSGPEAFTLVLDTTPPAIGPLPDGPHLFTNIESLLAVFPGGTVTEVNLRFLDVSFGSHTIRLLGAAPPPSPPANTGEHVWNFEAIRSELAAWFNEAGQGLQSITFVAEDMAGNRSPSINWDFTKDTLPPVVRFASFNQGRPIDQAENEFVAWGNVHFSVSVADAHGLGSSELPLGLPAEIAGEKLSNVKWWLLRHDAATPSWDTPFPTGRNGTGGRFFFRGHLSANFEAVFDSRALYDGEYKLYVIARDAAGNEQRQRLVESGVDTIRISQAADLPVLVGGEPVPGNGEVRRPDAAGNLRITGLARDTDGFDPAKVNNGYVEIRFLNGAAWGAWLPVPGTLDGTGAINFSFDVVSGGNRNANIPGFGDGPIRYQLRISDEYADIEGRTRNKNPQLEVGSTFLAAGNSLPFVPMSGAALSYFPGETESFSLVLDTTPPVIGFAAGDPSRMFRDIGGLLAALPGGTVDESNLYHLSASFGGETFLLSTVGAAHAWTLAEIHNELEALFIAAGQGPHTITFAAEDMAGNRSPPRNWDFTKDTEGPNLALLGGMRRSILHNSVITVAGTTRQLAESDFPDNWPHDWPQGDAWRTHPQWTDAFRNVIENWPSDFAFLVGEFGESRARAVLDRIEAERNQPPSVFDEDGTISGRFDDRLGTVWHFGNTAIIEYRFTRRGVPDANWSSELLHRGTQADNVLSWEIPLAGFDDGEYALDISFSDTAGNRTTVYGLRLFVDTEAPYFFVEGSPVQDDPNLFLVRHGGMAPSDGDLVLLDPNDRVFNAPPPGAANRLVFQLQGMVHDVNLQRLEAAIAHGPLLVPVPEGRLTLGPATGDGSPWTLRVYENDIRDIGEGASGISMTATDVANNRTAVQWPFFLDSSPPNIDFDLEHAVAQGSGFVLRGSADDATGISDIEFVLARWDYSFDNGSGAPRGAWFWFDGTGFNAAYNEEENRHWQDAGFAHTGDTRWVSWTVGPGELQGYPQLPEGKYKIDIRARDRALAWTEVNAVGGNPVDTANTGNVESRRFFIDDGAPVIRWADAQRQFFNTNPGTANLEFVFYVNDPNTVPRESFAAEIRADTNVIPVEPDYFDERDWYTGERRVVLRPPIVEEGQYTLVLTVRDAAGNTSNVGHTRTFNVGNTIPVPVVDTPANILAALAGPVTIRGRTTFGSGRIADVAFTLLDPNSDPHAWVDLYARTDWRRGDPAIWNDHDTGRELMRMHEYPGLSWTIEIPNTRNIVQSSAMDSLVPIVDIPDNLVWGNEPLESGEVRQMRLAIRAEDAAGNVNFATRDFWLHPGGDVPVVEIRSPEIVYIDGETRFQLLSGPFTIMGMARDNERVQDVYFRVWRYDPDGANPELRRLSVPNFGLDPYGQPLSGYQPADGIAIPEHGGGWYRARSDRLWETDWSAQINAYGELEPDIRGRNRIRIEVVALDAARLLPLYDWDDDNPAWDYADPMVSKIKTVQAYVVAGAPVIANEKARLFTQGADGAWTAGEWRHPADIHMGGQGRATFRFTVSHETGISAIRFRETGGDLQPQGLEIDLLDSSGGGVSDAEWEALLAELDAGATGAGIAVRAVRVCGTPMNNPGMEYDVYVEVHAELLANNLARVNTAFWFPLHVSAADVSGPNPNERRDVIRLPIDNSPPHAKHELNVWPAGMATLGGSARAGNPGELGVPGDMDRVVVWFQERDTAPGADGSGISWFDYKLPFEWGGEVNVPNLPGGRLRLPLIPSNPEARTGGRYAIVIDRNDPLRNQDIRWGNAAPVYNELGVNFDGETGIAMGWVPGGLGQIWNFTIDTMHLPSGPLDMHFVAFDLAGNAFHGTQRVTVMNNAPFITGIQFATDVRGNAVLQNDLGLGGGARGVNSETENGAQRPARLDIFGRIRALTHYSSFGSPTEIERDVRRGIAATVVPVTHMSSSATRGAWHDIDNFTVRNEFVALGVATPPAHSSAKRVFRVEYVSGARLLVGDELLRNIEERPGGVYLVENPGDVSWLSVGANHANVFRGYAFLAGGEIPAGLSWGSGDGAPSAWELNHHSHDLRLDAVFPADTPSVQLDRESGFRAEFAYGASAFAGPGPMIVDRDPGSELLHERYSMFIVKVFDNDLGDLFADFALLSVRVNNDDSTSPFAQLYDLNPRAENLGRGDRADDPVPAGVAPMAIDGGNNRTRGGLWRDASLGNLSRPGHIEPRRIPRADGAGYTHSLNAAQMGQDLNDPERVNVAAFFDVDTVSGRVVLRGYAEDDQRVGGVVLEFGLAGTAANPGALVQRIPILVPADNAPVNGTQTVPAQTGLLTSAQGDDVRFTDTMDLYRHRVEWAFAWDTAEFPAGFVVGDLVVRAIAVNAATIPANILAGNLPAVPAVSPLLPAGADSGEGTAAGVRMGVTERDHVNMRNFGFPANLQMYNSIRVNVRPYITGFARNTRYANFRSMQGHYALYRGGGGSSAATGNLMDETAVVTGFNLGFADGASAPVTTLVLPGADMTAATGALAGTGADFGLASSAPHAGRRFMVPHNAQSGDGLVGLRVTRGGDNFYAVNTGGERPADARPAGTSGSWRSIVAAARANGENANVMNGDWWVQPWNSERSLNAHGSDLWDNVTRVHIWQSNNDTTSGGDLGAFPRTGTIHGASMSVHPGTGVLHASHNEGVLHGTTSTGGWTVRSDNAGTPANRVTAFVDPIIQSDIFVDVGGQVWVASSVIGRNATNNLWQHMGGVFVHGPNGLLWNASSPVAGQHSNNNSLYPVQNNWYRASNQSSRMASPPADEQFRHPSVVVSGDHIHVAYFDSENNSINYRYNRRGQDGDGRAWGLGLINAANAGGSLAGPSVNSPHAVRRLWTNIDGGTDYYDYQQAGPDVNPGIGTSWLTDDVAAALGYGTRVVNHAANNTGNRSDNAGYHNDIAVTSYGFPVIVYFDAANQRLRMAISDDAAPVAGDRWSIVDHVIPVDNPAALGTGLYVSMRIDTRPNNHSTGVLRPDGTTSVRNTVHIAAFNPSINSLVYVMGEISGTVWTHRITQIVDNVGNVGRRSSVSLDEQGRPWIAYLDSAGNRLKTAFFDAARFTRSHVDKFGVDITGWETMHVPARWRVEEQRGLWSSQLGMENWPTRNVEPERNGSALAHPRFWRTAVAFLADDRLFRIAYLVE